MTASPNAKRQAKSEKAVAGEDQDKQRDGDTTIVPSPLDLRDPALYINRELSQFDFLTRVFDESLDENNPCLLYTSPSPRDS